MYEAGKKELKEAAELWQGAPALVGPLHKAAVASGCSYRVDEIETGKRIVYSARNLTIRLQGEHVSFSGQYDIRSFLRLYRDSDDDRVRKLLFNAAIPCCYCIDDKCTTLLMAEQRTIQYAGQSKKLCGPYRHNLTIGVDAENLSACVKIVNMMLERVYPHMHKDLAVTVNEVRYELADRDEFYLVGYAHKHSPISMSDEDFIASILQRDEAGQRKIDALLAVATIAEAKRYVGAVDDFLNGVSYSFIFGVMTDKKPDALPEGAVCRKVRSGQWAVYNSTASQYKSIWRHFTEQFYKLEHKGYDSSRIPFEYYDEEGRFWDVHIPVDADAPANSGMVFQVLHSPNEKLAGFRHYGEADYPLHQDRSFNVEDKVGKLFPHAQCLVRVSIHSLFGKPIMGFDGVPVDDLSVIPDGRCLSR